MTNNKALKRYDQDRLERMKTARLALQTAILATIGDDTLDAVQASDIAALTETDEAWGGAVFDVIIRDSAEADRPEILRKYEKVRVHIWLLYLNVYRIDVWDWNGSDYVLKTQSDLLCADQLAGVIKGLGEERK